MSEQLYVALTEDGTYLKKVTVESRAGTRTRYEKCRPSCCRCST